MVGYWGPPQERFVSMFQAMLLAFATGTALLWLFHGRITNRKEGIDSGAAKNP